MPPKRIPTLQDWVHNIEAGAGRRLLKYLLALLVGAAVAMVYDLCEYKNFSTQEAMDAAQLARNISEGKGYTTQFIRPFSIYLMGRKNRADLDAASTTNTVVLAQILDAPPDISNPPVYPLVLAGLMKVLPFHYATSNARPKSFWFEDGRLVRYQPDFLIALFNEFLFLVIAVALFLLARRLFDSAVGWMSAVLLLGTKVLWQFSVSGLSTMLLLLIFTGLVWCIVLLEGEARANKPAEKKLFGLAAGIGLLIGTGCLTRYAFGWMVIPVLIFLILFSGPKRAVLCVVMASAFLIVTAPWMIRNDRLSGAPFGTATYAALKDTDDVFPGYQLERSLNPNFNMVYPKSVLVKVRANAFAVLQNDFPNLSGNWAVPIFLIGLMIGFRNPAVRRLRYFLLLSAGVLIFVQAGGRTQLSADSPGINSQNVLVLLAPLVLIYVASLLFLLLDQMNLPTLQWRYLTVAAFGALMWLPMFTSKISPLSYPPYHPQIIRQTADYMKENELMMSDIPAAVAWYGNRPCVWLTLKVEPDFLEISRRKPVQALYLTPKTLGDHSLADWVRSPTNSWEHFSWDAMVKGHVPETFPLGEAPDGYMPDQIFLTDKIRW